ncbi:hypothetical protein, conserved [Trypanosoma brucei gambiense DAL972]|uniref:CSD domain-containing protein n=2 Tax=Trypanosoma brucei TaxID=5691 RepID=C9ZWT5_TRYB9|nr:hypothetical protein, conserved [Trypanosoma brucei gambiense DAL972]RHW71143.1 Cold-shock' DNA-binding domain containing protein [Trypanosoma brucei equiperdum]CBH13874.1 hypothetical protein, conserved [Trypanosoma brucei gambiense DAL972]|eukprot:XP_011776150.1 hypothetical protein, conserved [Trypanosoma brucei gambiense DAL972]
MLFHTTPCSVNGVPLVSFNAVAPFNASMGGPPVATPPGQRTLTTFYSDPTASWQAAVPLGKIASPPPPSRGSAASTPPSLTGSSPSVQHSSPNSQLGFRGHSGIIITSGGGGNVHQFHPHPQQHPTMSGNSSINSTSNMSPLPPGAMPACAWNLSMSPPPPSSQPIYVVLPHGPAPTAGGPMPPGAALTAARAPSSLPTTLPSRRGNGMMYQLGEWYEGVVKRYNPMRGFGFLTATHHLQVIPPDVDNRAGSVSDADGQNSQQTASPPQATLLRTPVTVGDVFVHQSYIRMQGFRALSTGDRVAFRVGKLPGKDANQAVSVQLLSTAKPATGATPTEEEEEDVQGSSSTTATTVLSGFSLTQHSSKDHEGDAQNSAPGATEHDVTDESVTHSDITVERLLAHITRHAIPSSVASTAEPLDGTDATNDDNIGGNDNMKCSRDGWVEDAPTQRRHLPFCPRLEEVAAALEATDFLGEAELTSPPAQWGLLSPSTDARGLFGGFDGK